MKSELASFKEVLEVGERSPDEEMMEKILNIIRREYKSDYTIIEDQITEIMQD